MARFSGFGKPSKQEKLNRDQQVVSSWTARANNSESLISSDCAGPVLTKSWSHSTASEGSLHDELTDPNPRVCPKILKKDPELLDCSTIQLSRPCYRCVSYMQSVGIRRVFWTNDNGFDVKEVDGGHLMVYDEVG